MRAVFTTIAAAIIASLPLALFAEEIYILTHPSVTGESVDSVYSYLADNSEEERMRSLFSGQTSFRPGIVSIVEVVDAIDFIFHPGAALVMDANLADYIQGRLNDIGQPNKLVIEKIAD